MITKVAQAIRAKEVTAADCQAEFEKHTGVDAKTAETYCAWGEQVASAAVNVREMEDESSEESSEEDRSSEEEEEPSKEEADEEERSESESEEPSKEEEERSESESEEPSKEEEEESRSASGEESSEEDEDRYVRGLESRTACWGSWPWNGVGIRVAPLFTNLPLPKSLPPVNSLLH